MNDTDLILYDLDGTLWDSIPVIMDSFRHAYEEVTGICQRPDEDLLSFIGKPLTDTFAMHDDETSRRLLKSYLDYNEILLKKDAIPLFPGVYDDLRIIKSSGILQGIVTSKRYDSAIITLKLKGLDEFFDVYVYHDDTTHHKPDPEPVLFAASRAGVNDMSRVIYVGDALPDAMCAKNAGSRFALVEWTRMNKEAVLDAAPPGSFAIPSLSVLTN